MGWLKLNRPEAKPSQPFQTHHTLAALPEVLKSVSSVEHFEILPAQPAKSQSRPRARLSISDAELPFITLEELEKVKASLSRIWIVLDGIVYDCTEFIDEHPGGATVIRNFSGEDCSWQFWRIHNRQHLIDLGRPLRVGRTEGVKNRFKEVPRYVGLRKLWNRDDW